MVCLNGWQSHVPLRDVCANASGELLLGPISILFRARFASLPFAISGHTKCLLINSFLNVMVIELVFRQRSTSFTFRAFRAGKERAREIEILMTPLSGWRAKVHRDKLDFSSLSTTARVDEKPTRGFKVLESRASSPWSVAHFARCDTFSIHFAARVGLAESLKT